jgi:hypothetical protein
MALKDIMAISGMSGLFKFVSQGRNGIIVESLTDGKRTHVSASAKVSSLSDIAIFTNDSEKPLSEVLEIIKQMEKSGPAISPKSSNDELKSYFIKVLPTYDVERVYVSDIKKLVSWYNQLQVLGLLDFAEEVEEAVEGKADDKSADAGQASDEKTEPKKKVQAKKTATDKKSVSKRGPSSKSKPMDNSSNKKNMHQKKS